MPSRYPTPRTVSITLRTPVLDRTAATCTSSVCASNSCAERHTRESSRSAPHDQPGMLGEHLEQRELLAGERHGPVGDRHLAAAEVDPHAAHVEDADVVRGRRRAGGASTDATRRCTASMRAISSRAS